MPHIKLTKSNVGSLHLPPFDDKGKAQQVFYRDTALPGFGLRVTSGGTKTYIVETRINGKNKRLSIGKHTHVTAEQARKKAHSLLGDIALGGDPLADKRAAQSRSVTLRQAYQDYLATRKGLKPNTLTDYQRCIEGALQDWLGKPLVEISKEMILDRHRRLGKRSEARANNTMRVLRAIFNFAIDQYEGADGAPILTTNPVNRLSKTRGWYKVKRKQSLIRPHELKAWYDATLQLDQETTRDYLHFILFTGLRRTEAARLTWDDVDFKARTFVIPDTKNSEPHYLPMSDYLEALLKRRYQQAEKIWVFPSPVTQTHIKEPRTAIEKVARLSGVGFILHDLRRTFITIAESLDIPAYALKRLLNHKFSNDVTAGYIVPNAERLREPMQRVTDYIQGQIHNGDQEK